MNLDYDTLMGMAPIVMEQGYTGRDSCIYALGVGCGVEPADDWMRQYLAPLPPARTLPTMATVLAAPRVHAMGLGLTMPGVLHGGQSLVSHVALPAEGRLRSETRIAEIFDRGEGRGCQVNLIRELRDAQTGIHYATLEQSLICRLDQAAGAPPADKPVPLAADGAPPDVIVAAPSSTQAAQIFSLTGDQNPLHLVPEVAAKAGFAGPILHGMATYGLCAAFAEKALCAGDGKWPGHRLGAISGKFSAPVFPGETIEIAIWHEPAGARIEARVPARDKVVFGDGRIAIAKAN